MKVTLQCNKTLFSLGLLLLCGCKTPSLEGIDNPYLPLVHLQRQQNEVWNELLEAAKSQKPLTVKTFTKDDAAHFLVLQIDCGRTSPLFATVGVLPSSEAQSSEVYLFFHEPTGGPQALEKIKIAEMFQTNLLAHLE